MDLYKELSLKLVKSEPGVWISRLVIFDRIAMSVSRPLSIR